MRVQVTLSTKLAEQVELVAKHEGVSLSKVVGQAMQQHTSTDEWQAQLDAANARRENLMASIADLPPEKQALILQALEG